MWPTLNDTFIFITKINTTAPNNEINDNNEMIVLTEVVSSHFLALACLECLDHLGGHLVLLPHQVPGHAVLLVHGLESMKVMSRSAAQCRTERQTLEATQCMAERQVEGDEQASLGHVLGELLEEVVGDEERLEAGGLPS